MCVNAKREKKKETKRYKQLTNKSDQCTEYYLTQESCQLDVATVGVAEK